MKICVDCNREFDPRESLMGDEEQPQCQLCWEAECDRSWWAMMATVWGATAI